ncbi:MULTISPECIES: ABC transporter permease subunit [unclassified Mesorhizobium]|uniref:ABC transporter permease subunit n=1 Tax=unclassified Mesorhizobium TaxID=325217 RepID=UPI003337F9AC
MQLDTPDNRSSRVVRRRRGRQSVFIALAAFQPTLINPWQGVSGIPRSYRELADVLTFGWFDFARIIAIPGALPQIFTGLHAALIYAWTQVHLAAARAWPRH